MIQFENGATPNTVPKGHSYQRHAPGGRTDIPTRQNPLRGRGFPPRDVCRRNVMQNRGPAKTSEGNQIQNRRQAEPAFLPAGDR